MQQIGFDMENGHDNIEKILTHIERLQESLPTLLGESMATNLEPTVASLNLIAEEMRELRVGLLDVLKGRAPENYIPQSTYDKTIDAMNENQAMIIDNYKKIIRWLLITTSILIGTALGVQGANEIVKNLHNTM